MGETTTHIVIPLNVLLGLYELTAATRILTQDPSNKAALNHCVKLLNNLPDFFTEPEGD